MFTIGAIKEFKVIVRNSLKHRWHTRPASPRPSDDRPSRSEAEEAVRVLLRWAGDDPRPRGAARHAGARARAYEEWFGGYRQDPGEYLSRTFEEVAGYDEIVALRDIRSNPIASTIWRRSSAGRISPTFRSGAWSASPSWRASSTSMPSGCRSRKKMTAEIASCLDKVPKPLGVAVVIESDPSVHDHARRSQAGRLDGDEPHAGRVQGSAADAAGVSDVAEAARSVVMSVFFPNSCLTLGSFPDTFPLFISRLLDRVASITLLRRAVSMPSLYSLLRPIYPYPSSHFITRRLPQPTFPISSSA